MPKCPCCCCVTHVEHQTGSYQIPSPLTVQQIPHFINPAFPSPSASFLGLMRSSRLGLLFVEVVPLLETELTGAGGSGFSSSEEELLDDEALDLLVACPFISSPPGLPPPGGLLPILFGSPGKKSRFSSLPCSVPPWRLNSSMLIAGSAVAE